MPRALVIDRLWRAAKAGLAALALAACAPTLGSSDRVETVPPEQALVGLSQPEAADRVVRHVRVSNSWEQEEYAYFAAGGARTEMLTSAAVRSPVALGYRLGIEDTVETWNFNRGRAKVWGGSGRAPFGGTPIFYRRYRLAEAGRDCFGFSAEWDHPSDDPLHRPGRVLFGYHCGASGAPLATGDVEAVLARIETREPRRLVDADPVPSAARTRAIRIARGVGTDESGSSSFPFFFAQWYDDTRGDGFHK